VSETTFDGTLIPETSFETLRSKDSLAKRVDACGAEKPRFIAIFLSMRIALNDGSPLVTIGNGSYGFEPGTSRAIIFKF
jgi:hypothetical protein